MASPAIAKILNTGWLTLEQLFRLCASFFVMALVARHLGPSSFGTYVYLFSVAGLVAPLAAFGLDSILMRRSAAAPGARDETLGSALAIRLCGGALGAALAVGGIAAFGGPEGTTPGLMALAALIVLAFPADTFNAWFKAREQMAWVAVPRIAAVLLVAGVTLWLVTRGYGLSAFVAVRAGEAALLALGAIAAYTAATGALGGLRVRRTLLSPLVREGWPLFLGSLAVVVYMRIDQVMLGWMAPERELGLYGVAVRVAEVAFFLPMALQAAFYASLVRAHARDPARFDAHMQRLYDVMALASYAAIVGIGVAAALLLTLVFGEAYAASLPMIIVLLLSLPAVFLRGARGAMLTVRGWLWTIPATASTGAVANILLNVWLIPHYGGMGAAWATVISLWFATYGTSWLFPWLHTSGRGMTQALMPLAAAIRLRRLYKG